MKDGHAAERRARLLPVRRYSDTSRPVATFLPSRSS